MQKFAPRFLEPNKQKTNTLAVLRFKNPFEGKVYSFATIRSVLFEKRLSSGLEYKSKGFMPGSDTTSIFKVSEQTDHFFLTRLIFNQFWLRSHGTTIKDNFHRVTRS